jgi:hypothetical protein
VVKVLGFLLFLVLAEDRNCAYAHHMNAPLDWIHPYLLEPTPIKLRPFDLVMLVVLFGSQAPRRPGLARPMRNALLLVLGTTVFSTLYGLTHGGEFRYSSWQTYLILSMVLSAFAIAAACRTPAHFIHLAKWLVAAAVYRALMCWISYFTWAKGLIGQSGEFITSHADTITWVVSIMVLLVEMVDRRSVSVRLRNLLLILFFLGAIQFNSRRLAWVSLTMGLVMFYVLFPQGVAKRRINRVLVVLSPLILAYVVVGWGRPEKIFLPLASFSSVSTQEDSSTLARNAENLGLIFTGNSASRAFGTGWGRPYSYLTLKYDISGFELWRYVPHNSILGLLAFTGILGFAGFWLAVPTSVYFNARVARLAADTAARRVALIGVAQLIVCCNQLYGDMGIFEPAAMYVVAVSYAMALRLPTRTGLWGPAAPPPNQAPAPQPIG